MTSRTYRFGEFELHESRFELCQKGMRVELQPKALDLLFYFVRNPDRVVLKDELLAGLWPGVKVSDASLSKAVSAVRRAIGDSGEAQSSIQTVRGRGFRFVAVVEECEPGVPDTAAMPASSPSDGHEPQNDFVGRVDILTMINVALAAASQGSGRLIFLRGEAGMGKTRAAQEAAARCSREGSGRALMGWCSKGEGAPALWPWLQLLRPIAAKNQSVLAVLGEAGSDLKALLLPLGARESSSAAATIEPEQARFRFFETVTRLLESASRRAPHLLILDDFHWADRTSLMLLDFLSHTISTLPLVLVVTYREEDLPQGSALNELARRPECHGKTLVGLGQDEVAQLVESEVGSVNAAVVEMIHQRTGGNPFFIKELARSLAAENAPESSGNALSPLPLPGGITEVLGQRLERLGPRCLQTLLLAATIGREVDLGLLSALADRSADVLLGELDEAVAARLIRCEGATLSFVHGLVREALLERLSSPERSQLHRRIGETLARLHRDDLEPHLAALAYHFCAAVPSGCVEQAIDYSKRAGDRAVAILASHEAVAHYGRAIELYSLLRDPDERLHCELLLAAGEAQVCSGEAEKGRATLRQAADLARRLGAAELLGRVALASGGLELSVDQIHVYDPDLIALLEEALTSLPPEQTALRVRLLVRLVIALTVTRDFDRCAELIREAVESARRIDDPVALIHALYIHRYTLDGPGQMEARIADCNEMLRLARRARRRDLESAALSSRFVDLVELGRFAAADLDLDAYEQLAVRLGVPRYRWRAQLYRALRTQLDGRFSEAEEIAGRSLADAQRFGFKDGVAVYGGQLLILRSEQARLAEIEPVVSSLAGSHPNISSLRAALALMHAELGRLAEARDAFESFAVDDFQDVPRGYLWLGCLVVLSEVCCRLDDAERAMKLRDLLRPYAPRTVMLGVGVACLGALDRFLGSLSTTARDWPAAAGHFESALRMNTRIGARPQIAWTHCEWARFLFHRNGAGDSKQARTHLVRARESAAALGMTRLTTRVDGLAREFA